MRNADTQQQTDSGCCVPAGMSCPRFTPAVLFYRRTLCPACARHCVSLAAYCPRFTPAVCLAPNRTACGILRSCSAGSRSPFVRSRSVGAVICLLWVHFGFGRFFMAISTGYRDAGTELRGGQGWRRGLCAFCAATLALLRFPPGVRWGSAPQTCAKESSTLWTLFTLRRGYVGAYSCHRNPGTRVDLTGSNLWPGRSCGRTIVPVHAIA